MRILTAAVLATAAIGALGACSKPSEPSNPAIATEQNAPASAVTPGDNSFTEGQAKGHLENAGYTNISAMTQDDKGAWTGTATKDGQTVSVSVDYQGNVVTK
jgi:putative membrane protein